MSESLLEPAQSLLEQAKSVSIERGKRGLCLNINNARALASVSLFGGQLLSYIDKSDARERLWLSESAIFDGKTPIRGGVPICWPWFGAPTRPSLPANSPSHGFVRTRNWELCDIQEQCNSCGEVIRTSLMLMPQDLKQALTFYGLPPSIRVSLKLIISDTCTITLHTQYDAPQGPVLALSQAIHSYFSIPDIATLEIKGIHGKYADKVNSSQANKSPSPYRISSETDRIHAADANEHIKLFSGEEEWVSIEHAGHNGTVVWNPWQEKSRQLKDMNDSGFTKMVCIEAATMPEVVLHPGQLLSISQCVSS
ncbi:D-hexose-6-phosphate mutarotase [Glaciecola siphonariae]|uniref:Putative glucose-6-phosphate 1-epimerase n=1 Tax=Glaciecola siphonariae TaxID=521012 RepID=A0ABV9LT20_9ALTE